MSRRRERIEKAEEGIAQLQDVLGSATSALTVAAEVDDVAIETVRKGRRLLKWLLVMAGLAVVVVLVRKVMAGSDDFDRDEIDLGEDRFTPAA